MDTATPMISTRAKPRTTVVPCQYSQPATSIDEGVPRFVAWLLEFGASNPGHVLFPASDELVWIFAEHKDALSKDFHLAVPSLDTVYRILNKRRLHEACAKVGHVRSIQADDVAPCIVVVRTRHRIRSGQLRDEPVDPERLAVLVDAMHQLSAR